MVGEGKGLSWREEEVQKTGRSKRVVKTSIPNITALPINRSTSCSKT